MKTMENSILLSFEELNKLKQSGAGTDGIIYNYKKDILVKVYREKINEIINFKEKMDDEIKIYDKNSLEIKNDNSHITYFESDGNEDIKIRTKNAIEKAIEKQKNITRTELPKGSVYIDNKFSGCYLKRVHGIQIHKLSGLPMKQKLKIMKSVFLDIEELINNNIYHIDLGNSPFCTTSYKENDEIKYTNGHSHVLVNPFNLKTNIIDLDGQSTIYKERRDYVLESSSVSSLCNLIMEFLFFTNIDEFQDSNEIYYELLNNNAPEKFAYALAFNTISNLDDLKKVLKF